LSNNRCLKQELQTWGVRMFSPLPFVYEED
jgi:hypothetical protein